MYKLALLIVILATVQGQLISNGQCTFPNQEAKAISLPNMNAYGTFYEIERIKNNWNTGQCTLLNLTITDIMGAQEISIEMKEVLDHKLITRSANVTSDDKLNNTYNVVFPDFTSNFTFIGVEDGDGFVVAYACSNVEGKKQEYAWVLGVNTTLTESDKIAARTIIETIKLKNATWVESSHTADSCKSGTNYIKLSPIIVLIVGFLVTKGL